MNDKRRHDEAATRRRWVSLAETVAIAGVFIAGLTLYLSWVEKREDRAERKVEQAQAREATTQARGRIGLVATEVDGDALGFKSVACALQSADITFPSALKVAPQNTVLDHRIDTDWFAKPLLKVAAAAKVEQGVLPVLIASRCIGEDGDRREQAIYDLPYRVRDRFLRGSQVRLRGLVLRERGGDQRRLDAIWKQTAPKPVK